MDRLVAVIRPVVGSGVSLRKHRGHASGQELTVGVDTMLGSAAGGVSVQVEQAGQQDGVGEVESASGGRVVGRIDGGDRLARNSHPSRPVTAGLRADDSTGVDQEVEWVGVHRGVRQRQAVGIRVGT